VVNAGSRVGKKAHVGRNAAHDCRSVAHRRFEEMNMIAIPNRILARLLIGGCLAASGSGVRTPLARAEGDVPLPPPAGIAGSRASDSAPSNEVPNVNDSDSNPPSAPAAPDLPTPENPPVDEGGSLPETDAAEQAAPPRNTVPETDAAPQEKPVPPSPLPEAEAGISSLLTGRAPCCGRAASANADFVGGLPGGGATGAQFDLGYGPYVAPPIAGVHGRYPYYSYRRPWYPVGPVSANITIVW
jgi:hypothetical protein